jgi:tyrosyl-tRNA synthetase
MFRKVMGISDVLMYRYYTLLTDMPEKEIKALEESVCSGRVDPMNVKMDLARRIVADFHGGQEADAARGAFDREVRQGLEPADTETVSVPAAAWSDRGIRIDKLIAAIGLADSNSDATRKLKSGAVEINNAISKELVIPEPPPLLVIRVGKKWKRVNVPRVPPTT